jgi:hypothetical protein
LVKPAFSQADTAKTPVVTPQEAINYIGKKVTVYAKAEDFDPRKENRYLFFGAKYPNQCLTIILKPDSTGSPLKLKWSIIARKATAYFTGVITIYKGKPDKTVRPDAEKLNNQKFVIYPDGKTPVTGVLRLRIPTYPIDLYNHPIMIIDKLEQVVPGEMVAP